MFEFISSLFIATTAVGTLLPQWPRESITNLTECRYIPGLDFLSLKLDAPFPDGKWTLDFGVNFMPYVSINPIDEEGLKHGIGYPTDLTDGDSLYMEPAHIAPHMGSSAVNYGTITKYAAPHRGFDQMWEKKATDFPDLSCCGSDGVLLSPLNRAGAVNRVSVRRIRNSDDQQLYEDPRSFIRYEIETSFKRLNEYRHPSYPLLPLVDPLNLHSVTIKWNLILGSDQQHPTNNVRSISHYINFNGPTARRWIDSDVRVYQTIWKNPDDTNQKRSHPIDEIMGVQPGDSVTIVIRPVNKELEYSFGAAIRHLIVCRASYANSTGDGRDCHGEHNPSSVRTVVFDYKITDACINADCVVPGREPKCYREGETAINRHNRRFPSLRSARTIDSNRLFVRAGDGISIKSDALEAMLGKLASGEAYFFDVRAAVTSLSPDPAWLAQFDRTVSRMERQLLQTSDNETSSSSTGASETAVSSSTGEASTITIMNTNTNTNVNQNVNTVVVDGSAAVVAVPSGCTHPLFDVDGHFVRCSSVISIAWWWWLIIAVVGVGIFILILWSCRRAAAPLRGSISPASASTQYVPLSQHQ